MTHCTSCGLPIPEGQGNSCSMCYGDPYYGEDGYYLQYLEEQERQAAERRAEEERQWQIEQERMHEKSAE